jgi:hypothetical protein
MALVDSNDAESSSALVTIARDVATLAERQAITDAKLREIEQLVQKVQPPPTEYRTVPELAELWRVTPRTIERVLKKHPDLPRKYVLSCVRIDPKAFEEAMPDLVLKWQRAASAGAQRRKAA